MRKCLRCRRLMRKGTQGAWTEDKKAICNKFECIMSYLLEVKKPLTWVVYKR